MPRRTRGFKWDNRLKKQYVSGTEITYGGTGGSITSTETPPSNPQPGDTWFDTSTGSFYIYYDDGGSQQWVGVGGRIGATGPAGTSSSSGGSSTGGSSLSTGDTAPLNPSDGDLWFDTTGLTTYVYYNDGGSGQWVSAMPSGVSNSGGGSSTPAIDSDSTVNESPMILTEPPTAHTLNRDGTTSTVTMLAEDPEGFGITYGIAYKNSGNTRPAQLAADTTVDANGVYTFTPTTTSSNEGSFTARLSATDGVSITTRTVDFSLSFIQSMFEPAGTTLLLGVSFDSGNTSVTGTYTITPSGTLSFSSDGSGVANTEYATGWDNNINFLQIDDLSAADSGQNKTYIAWYKGTQTATTPTNYSPGVPIFGDPRTSVWTGFGVNGGVIYAAGSGTAYSGTTSIADDSWHMLAWTYSSTNDVNAFVDGTQEITNADLSGGVGNNRVDHIGTGYAYTGIVAPTALDNIQIFDGVLTQSQIQEIYNKAVGA